MLTLLGIADMLADVLEIEDVYAGTIDANKNCCIGVYPDKNVSTKHRICIGGKACTITKDKAVSILIHWTDNPTSAEQEAQSVLEKLTDIRDYSVSESVKIKYIDPCEPQSVGRDERGVCEYVIVCKIYYQESEE